MVVETESNPALDVRAIRRQFVFTRGRRIVTNNAASTQPPRRLLDMYTDLAPLYENVHRGQSTASKHMTAMFEAAYDTIASFINAPNRKSVILYRNATEANNAVMYSLLTQFRDGDNVVTTMMEHNSNYVPWYAMCREILSKFGIRVQCRLALFNKETGELDLEQMASLIDSHTKLVCCTAASNFLGTINPIAKLREMTELSGYEQPTGERRSYLLVDAAQYAPTYPIDVRAMDVDFLSFSFHKMLAPFGVGVLYGKEHILESALPFLYGGDMIEQGKVTPEHVGYNTLPWKFVAGTPNVLGTILSGQAVRILLDFALNPEKDYYFNSGRTLEYARVKQGMDRVSRYSQQLARRAIEKLSEVPGIRIYGPLDPTRRVALVAFNLPGRNPMDIAEDLNKRGVESRAGCHCATLAHHYLGLDPPASCRLSFYVYNTLEEVDFAASVLKKIALEKMVVKRAFWSRYIWDPDDSQTSMGLVGYLRERDKRKTARWCGELAGQDCDAEMIVKGEARKAEARRTMSRSKAGPAEAG